MASLSPLLISLDIKPSDKVISIKENGNIDSNFIITHLMKQVLIEGNKLVLVIFHNTLGHYHNIGKRLGYDFLKQVDEGCIKTIEPLKDIVDNIGNGDGYFLNDKEEIVKGLFNKIKANVDELVSKSDGRVYLIIDDISHFLDLGVDLRLVIFFTNYCLSLVNRGNVCLITNNHVSTKSDEIISNNLNYISDVVIEILPLKTGISREVTGVINIENKEKSSQFHFKSFDKGIKIFHLGESVYNLYR